MVEACKKGDLDVIIALTEGLVADVASGMSSSGQLAVHNSLVVRRIY